MKLYKIKINPLSSWGTYPKGDTLFGRFCWQIVYDDGEKKLEEYIKNYETDPFCIFSSAYPIINKNNEEYIVFKTPSLPLKYLFEESEIRDDYKTCKKKKYIIQKLTNNSLMLDIKSEKLSDIDLEKKYKVVLREYESVHNTINRLTFMTGKESFAPYRETYFSFYGFNFVFFCLSDLNKDYIKKEVENIGKIGFGKDQSLGYGRFDVIDVNEVEITSNNSNTYYALSPFITDVMDNNLAEIYFSPFIRYGKFGDEFSDYIKKPIIMADEGSIIKKELNNLYYGKGLSFDSFNKKIISQGYTICLSTNINLNN